MMTTYNVYGLRTKRAVLCTIIDREESVMVALEGILMSETKRTLWLQGYTTIESKRFQEDGSHVLAFAVRKTWA